MVLEHHLRYYTTQLEQGKYRDWFWTGLNPQAANWLKREQCPNCRSTPRTNHMCKCYRDRAQPAGWVNRESLVWRLQAACQGANTEIFFPANEALYNHPEAPWREYCVDCPVTGHCRLTAADSKSVGIWGGIFLEMPGKQSSANPIGTGKRGRPRKVAI